MRLSLLLGNTVPKSPEDLSAILPELKEMLHGHDMKYKVEELESSQERNLFGERVGCLIS